MSWLEKILPAISSSKKKNIPQGIWRKCSTCEITLYYQELEKNLFVCPKCGAHGRIGARTRIDLLLDSDTEKVEIAKGITTKDPLKFRDQKKYKERHSLAQKTTKETEALVAIFGKLHQRPIVVAAFEFNFMGGSMGFAVGQKFTEAVHFSIEHKTPMICVSASGGARMQEGLFSLLQMSKVALALNFLNEAKLPFISILTDPTMGGVSASLAMLGDINIAEPNALIGFAGPRVIAQTVKQDLPKGFQRSEFLLEKGAIDMVVTRSELRPTIATLLHAFSFYNDNL